MSSFTINSIYDSDTIAPFWQ